MSAQQNAFKKAVEQIENSVIASYLIAEKIAHSTRLFTDGEFVRDCMQKVAKVLLPDKTPLFEEINLSRNTVARRMEDIGEDLSGRLSSKTSKFQYFSLAFDEVLFLRCSLFYSIGSALMCFFLKNALF